MALVPDAARNCTCATSCVSQTVKSSTRTQLGNPYVQSPPSNHIFLIIAYLTIYLQFHFKLGAGEVIKGWDEGLVGMKVGGERTLEVPPQLGYGKKSMSDIPANSTLFFGASFVFLFLLLRSRSLY